MGIIVISFMIGASGYLGFCLGSAIHRKIKERKK